MEIFSCDSCSARISNQDIERGDAVVYEGEVYCYHCVPEGVDPDSLPKPKRRGSKINLTPARRRPGAAAAARGRGRRPSSGTDGRKTPGSRTKKRTPSASRMGEALGGGGGSAKKSRKPSSSRTARPASTRVRSEAAPPISAGIILIFAAVLGIVVGAAAFVAMRVI